MVPTICPIPECGNAHLARGWCSKHYRRWSVHGDALVTKDRVRDTCSFEGCGNLSKAHGLCGGHLRQRSKDLPLAPLTRRALGFDQRFWSKVNKTESCWIWVGGHKELGYGLFKLEGRTRQAHRVAYETMVGAIPEGLFLDHKCRTPACVNPEHLRPVTHKQNMEHQTGEHRVSRSRIRGVSENHGRWRARVTHNGRLITVGNFATIKEAEAAVIAKRLELFTHNDLDRAA